jgi:transglutaminase-like putative cysteine protease
MRIRLYIVALLFAQAYLLATSFNAGLIPYVLASLGIVGAVARIRIDASFMRISVAAAVAVLVVSVVWTVAGNSDFPQPISFIGQPSIWIAAHSLLLFQALHLFLNEDKFFYPRLLSLAVLTLGCPGMLIVLGQTEHIRYALNLSPSIVLFGLIVSHLSSGPSAPAHKRLETGKRMWSAAVLVSAMAIAFSLAWLLKRNQNEMEAIAGNFLALQPVRTSTGFSKDSRLGSVANMQGNEGQGVSLRIFANDSPGYLRGRANEMFDGQRWKSALPKVPLKGIPAVQRSAERITYLLREDANSDTVTAEIWRALECDGVLFTTLDTTRMSVNANDVTHDASGNLLAEDVSDAEPYSIDVAPGAEQSEFASMPDSEFTPDQFRNLLTSVPDKTDPAVRALAEQLFANCHTAPEKIAAVVRYFHENFKYKIGIRIPPGKDPLTHFLLERPPSHCEYFASGAAILLRLGGVPCRYVTGFFVSERNDWGGYWVARNRDAHAWVEAYDESLGWVLVEATVPDGMPGGHAHVSAWRDWWDSVRMRVSAFMHSFKTGSWQAKIKDFFSLAWSFLRPLVVTVPGLLITLVLTGIIGYKFFRRWQAKPRPRKKAEHDELSKLLAIVDKHLARSGIVRAPAETLHQFSKRLRESTPEKLPVEPIAAWYIRYAEVRFRGPADDTAIEELKLSAPNRK